MAKTAPVYWLSDSEWAAVEPHLPMGRRGARRVDDRRVISGIVHMLRSRAPWRTCPAVYGPYTTVYNRFNRWRRQGVWSPAFEALTGQSGGVPDPISVPSVPSHRPVACARAQPSVPSWRSHAERP
jgi:transposase